MTTPEPSVKFALVQHKHIACASCPHTVIILTSRGVAEIPMRHSGSKHLTRLTPADLRRIADELEAMQSH